MRLTLNYIWYFILCGLCGYYAGAGLVHVFLGPDVALGFLRLAISFCCGYLALLQLGSLK
jgi:hypothetical protein